MFGWLRSLGTLLRKAFALVSKVVTNEHVTVALELIAEAALIFATTDGGVNEAKAREYVVKSLVNRFGIPESLARYILELAYQLYRSQRPR